MKQILVILILPIFLLVSCSPSQVQFKDMDSLEGAALPSLTINHGNPYTNNLNVTVHIYSPKTSEMFISEDSQCQTGAYQPQKSDLPYALLKRNSDNRVYGKFRNQKLYETACVEAGILHDDIPPTISWIKRPKAETNQPFAQLMFQGQDSGSGLFGFECSDEGGGFSPCISNLEFTSLADRRYKVLVKARDKAGNFSDALNADWLVDTKGPEVEITAAPEAISTSRKASFEFRGTDAGVGIDRFLCSIGRQEFDPCLSPKTFPVLNDGKHRFSVWAVDRLGNMSNVATHDFEIDNVPSGFFSVIGVTSNHPSYDDQVIDHWLVSLTPKVHFTQSQGAIRYVTRILKQSIISVCGEITSTNLVAAFSPSDCVLEDNTVYVASVTAFDNVGNSRNSTLMFFTDMTPPLVKIRGPFSSADNLSARIEFTVDEPAPGKLSRVTCYHSYKDGTNDITNQQSCDIIRTIRLSNLIYGDHRFRVVAQDAAGNVGEDQIDWKVVKAICDPFASNNEICQGGLIGDLYYLDAQKIGEFQAAPIRNAQFFFDKGTKVDAQLNFQKLFIPTRNFVSGFPISGGDYIRDERGNILHEYFAFKLQTVVKLDSDNVNSSLRDGPGLYQFASLSDDGTLVRILKGNEWVQIIDNDNDHNTRLICAKEYIEMKENTRLGLQVDYYQGPKPFVALTVLWRKVDTFTPNDPLCGIYGDEAFFGPSPYLNFTDFGWGQLMKSGWKFLKETNYIRPE